MEERFNIAEILKNCPTGMELDCTILDSEAKVFLEEVLDDDFSSPIVVTIKHNNIEYHNLFTKYGAFNDLPYCKCVIFPKGKTSWEGFVSPHEFKNGDIIFTRTFDSTWVSIFKQFSEDRCCTYIDLCIDDNDIYNTWGVCHIEEIKEQRLATEKEKLKLFDAISAYNYESNEETKTLEKLPKFKVGDWVIDKQDIVHQIANVIENVTNHTYGYDIVGGGYFNDNTEGVRLWTIQDAKDGDVLVHNSFSFIFMGIKNGIVKGICTELGDTILNLGNPEYDNDYCPATKEQRALLFQKMKESGYEWDAEKKEKKKIEQKPAWSEEDEKILEIITSVLRVNFEPTERFIGYEEYMNVDLINWLKSLKDRCIWKPSDKQMEQLGWIAEQNKNNMIGQELMTLYNDLKKLKE